MSQGFNCTVHINSKKKMIFCQNSNLYLKSIPLTKPNHSNCYFRCVKPCMSFSQSNSATIPCSTCAVKAHWVWLSAFDHGWLTLWGLGFGQVYCSVMIHRWQQMAYKQSTDKPATLNNTTFDISFNHIWGNKAVIIEIFWILGVLTFCTQTSAQISDASSFQALLANCKMTAVCHQINHIAAPCFAINCDTLFTPDTQLY